MLRRPSHRCDRGHERNHRVTRLPPVVIVKTPLSPATPLLFPSRNTPAALLYPIRRRSSDRDLAPLRESLFRAEGQRHGVIAIAVLHADRDRMDISSWSSS